MQVDSNLHASFICFMNEWMRYKKLPKIDVFDTDTGNNGTITNHREWRWTQNVEIATQNEKKEKRGVEGWFMLTGTLEHSLDDDGKWYV